MTSEPLIFLKSLYSQEMLLVAATLETKLALVWHILAKPELNIAGENSSLRMKVNVLLKISNQHNSTARKMG